MFVEDRFGSAVAALMGGAHVVADAIQADPQIGAALVTGFTASGLACQRPFPATLVAMSGH